MLFHYLLYFFFLLTTVVPMAAPPLTNSRTIHNARLLVSPVFRLLSDVPSLVLAGFSFFKTFAWEARITATGTGVDIDKVEYSDDGKHYLTGTSFTSDTEITKFYIRVTDSKGNVTNWLYENGKVTQK